MFSSVSKFCTEGREDHSVPSKLEGALLISVDSFPYFMLVAFEAGGPVRALFLLLTFPLLWLLNKIYSDETMALRVMIFTTFLGLKVTDVKAVAKAVLPRFYLEDLHENAYKAFSSCRGKKAEDPLKNCLGLVAAPAVVARVQQYEAIRATLGDGNMIDVGIADTALTSHPYVLLCKEVYFVPVEEKAPSLPRKDYSKPLIFHDGRAVVRPTPLNALAVLLWVPMGVILAITRLSVGKLLPYKLGLMAAAATGLKIRAKLPPPVGADQTSETTHTPYTRCTCDSCDPGFHTAPFLGGYSTKSRPNNQTCNTLYVCSHRTLIDPVIVASALQRHVTAVTYSVSRVSELLSPIRTVRLRRDRADDGATMRGLLMQGDLVVCPEGTTCREPYLLRFSPLFAEIADVIVPVDVSANATMFHGTTVRGYKWLDSFFFLMNPNPHYHLQFLDKVAGVRTCESLGKSSYDIANQVQQMIGRALGFQCTNFTRRDKYRTLAGNDGVGKAKEVVESNTPHVCSI
uniref:Phospholipid/glycerol acyltransferase domain-containing protein n=1 Tax=Nelumbo nucifera TaxID=4432 RepID=A0A822YXU7_NELNU|nr:TPA_asm: hypothetical protein HUJ06_007971 [Nelumbo nucifera]